MNEDVNSWIVRSSRTMTSAQSGITFMHNNQRLISIAPMMGYTDRHFRMLMRLISKNTLLYTEMVTTQALLRGRYPEQILTIYPEEHPVALQLGGSEPEDFAACAKMAANSGFDEINLNIGCPSSRVSAGRFGACLMKEPERVADCVAAIKAHTHIPVTIKTRIGVDDQDDYSHLCHFVQKTAQAGCQIFIVHARKAWLKGLSPKENRQIPPLCYDKVYRLKQDFPHLTIIINGGIKSMQEIDQHLQKVDGVMIGRAAYQQPLLFSSENLLTPKMVVLKYAPYLLNQFSQGHKCSTIIRHLHGLVQGKPGAKQWRRYLHEQMNEKIDMNFIEGMLEKMP